jgi:glycolate oxidase FAD binding subunit
VSAGSLAWRTALERGLGSACVSSWHGLEAELPLVAPRAIEELIELVRLAAREEKKLLPIGFGSKLSWSNPSGRADALVSLRDFAGIVAYEPGDGTLTARAGSSMAELARVVRAGGHHLTPDVPEPARASLGGMVSAGQSGFDRLRYGPVRGHVLGTLVLLADGSIARSGGRLVKNVTGYDLHRLHCGAHGTLGILLEVSLRLWPLPEEHAWLCCPCRDRSAALEAALGVQALFVKPLAVLARSEARWALEVGLAGRADVVAWEVAELTRVLRPSESLCGAQARERIEAARDRALEHGAWPEIELAARPSRLDAALAELEAGLDDAGVPAEIEVHPLLATAAVRLRGAAPIAGLCDLHERLLLTGVRVRWPNAPRGLARTIDVTGPSPDGLELMHTIQRALDPDGRFALERFHDRI